MSPPFSALDATVAYSVIQCACERAMAWRGFEHAWRAGWRSKPEVREHGIVRHWLCPDCAPPDPPPDEPEQRPIAVPVDLGDRVRRCVWKGEIDPDFARSLEMLARTDPDLFDAFARSAIAAAVEAINPPAGRRGSKRTVLAFHAMAARLGVAMKKPKMPTRPKRGAPAPIT